MSSAIIMRCIVAALIVGMVWLVYGMGRNAADLEHAEQAAELRRARDIAQEAARRGDRKLADLQASVAQLRASVVIKKQVIYREKIKVASIASCVATSGLLDLYDASLGLSDNLE